jgi:hypothetical protein
VGARKILIAYNIYLNTGDVSVARDIARAVRASSGGLRCVKAIGVEMKSRGLAQVSINLTDFEETPLHRVFEAVEREAGLRGCGVVGSEIIGLVPRKAIELSREYDLRLENFSPDRVLENRLAAVAGILPPPPVPTAEPLAALQPLVDTLREAIQKFSERALHAARETPSGAATGRGRVLENHAESFLDAGAAAADIYERLVQLETMAAPSMLVDWMTVKQAAMAAARSALREAEAILPSLQDAATARKIKSRAMEIEAKLSTKPVTTET